MNDDIKTANRIRKDGWANLFTGLGTKADKSKHTVNTITTDEGERLILLVGALVLV